MGYISPISKNGIITYATSFSDPISTCKDYNDFGLLVVNDVVFGAVIEKKTLVKLILRLEDGKSLNRTSNQEFFSLILDKRIKYDEVINLIDKSYQYASNKEKEELDLSFLDKESDLDSLILQYEIEEENTGNLMINEFTEADKSLFTIPVPDFKKRGKVGSVFAAFGEYFAEIGLIIWALVKSIGINIAVVGVKLYYLLWSFGITVFNLFRKDKLQKPNVEDNKFVRKNSSSENKRPVKKAGNGEYIHHTDKKEVILNVCFYVSLTFLAIVFLYPFFIVLLNSFKTTTRIVLNPMEFPDKLHFENYSNGLAAAKFVPSFFRSLYVTVVSTGLILLTTSMCSWVIVRVKNKFTKILYYVFLMAMVVPFQLVMKPMVIFTNNYYHIANIWLLPLIYVGFGAGLSVFMFTGFIKSIPYEIEEAACIDGCSPIKTFFKVVAPIMKPTYITVAILNVMWIWNDFLLPYSILGSKDATIPMQIQFNFLGDKGAVYYDQMMAVILVSIIPVIVFYLLLQKYIIKGVSDGAVKA